MTCSGFSLSVVQRTFLVLYIEQDSEIFDSVAKPGLMLNSVSEVPLALRLHELGLLPEETRQKFIAAVSQYVLDGEDFYALQSDRLRHVFSEDEFDELQAPCFVRSCCLGSDDVRHEWQSNHQSDESADDHMQPLLEAFETLEAMFDDDETGCREDRSGNETRAGMVAGTHARRFRREARAASGGGARLRHPLR